MARGQSLIDEWDICFTNVIIPSRINELLQVRQRFLRRLRVLILWAASWVETAAAVSATAPVVVVLEKPTGIVGYACYGYWR